MVTAFASAGYVVMVKKPPVARRETAQPRLKASVGLAQGRFVGPAEPIDGTWIDGTFYPLGVIVLTK